MADAIRKHKKVSKKSKKSWRKNTNIADVEEYLEDVRRDERTGLTEQKANDAIFFVDKEKTKGKKIDKKQIQLNADDDGDDDEEVYVSRRERMLKRLVQDKQEEQRRAEQLNQIKSIWGQEIMAVKESFLEPAYKKPKLIPKTVGVGKAPIDALEIPHEGSSYNPDYDSHQKLLAKVHIEELQKHKERKKLNKKVKMISVVELKKQPQIWLKEMSEGLNVTNNEVDDKTSDSEDTDEDADENLVASVKKTAPKTLKEKRKQREKKEEEKKLLEKKKAKVKLNEVYLIKKMKKEINESEKKSLERQLKRREKSERIRTKRLAIEKFEEGSTDVQLSEELSGSLRQLKPEGNLLKDRFKSLQKRNIIEVRKPVIPKRRYKRKTYVPRSYHSLTIKDFKSKT